MKSHYLLLSFCCLLFSLGGMAQLQHPQDRYQSNITVPQETTMKSRYGIEFEFVDEALLGDSSILEQINPLTLDYFRTENEDIIFPYRSPSIEILIYSRKRISKKTTSLLETE